MELTLPLLIGGLILGGVLVFFAGLLLGRGRGPARLAELKSELASKQEPPPHSRESVETKKVGEPEELRKELDMANQQLHVRDHQIEEYRENINRLGKRILDVETELHAKEEELVEMRKRSPEKDLIDSMDPFVDALQKESDQLRDELENAYRVVNRQELELARLRSGTLELRPDSTVLQEKIDNLNMELDSMRQKISRYEEAMFQNPPPSDEETRPFPGI